MNVLNSILNAVVPGSVVAAITYGFVPFNSLSFAVAAFVGVVAWFLIHDRVA